MLKPNFLIGGHWPTIQGHASACTNDDFMVHALQAGMRGIGTASPNPAVGCVLVCDDRIIGEGVTQPYGGWHGERAAIEILRGQSVDWSKVTAYVTLEPCSHVGKQPPCADLLLKTGISKVVIAALDPNLAGAGLQRLQSNAVQCQVGSHANEALAWNLNFMLNVKRNKIVYAAKWAQSIDGQWADNNGVSQWITGPQARLYTHWLRQKYDAILVGAGTVMSDFPALTSRECPLQFGSQPTKLIFDPSGRIFGASKDQRHKLINTTFFGDDLKIVYCTLESLKSCPREWRDILSKQVVFLNPDTGLDRSKFISDFKQQIQNYDFTKLRGKPLQSILIEGGPGLMSAMIGADIPDVYHVFVAPFILGVGASAIMGGANNSVFPIPLSNANRMDTLATMQMGQDILIECMPKDRFDSVFSVTVKE